MVLTDLSPLDRAQRVLGDRYLVKQELGRGAAARVYLAHDHVRACDIAAKVLRIEYAAAVSEDRFLREVEIVRQLDHPNILPILESGSSVGVLFYTMPFVEGGTLRDRLTGEPQLALSVALSILRDVASALDYAHARGVVHRDVKPANTLMQRERAVIGDFGIARAMQIAVGKELTDSGIALGTPEYMSPEQIDAVRHLDGRTDVYGLGCMLYEMLAGEPPFRGPTPQATMARHRSETPRSLRIIRPSIPEEMERAIGRALAKKPAERFATAGEFATAITP